MEFSILRSLLVGVWENGMYLVGSQTAPVQCQRHTIDGRFYPAVDSCANSTSDDTCLIKTALATFKGYCQRGFDGKRYLTMQRRVSNSASFYRTYAEYEEGLEEANGDPLGNLWLGNKNIYAFTNSFDNS